MRIEDKILLTNEVECCFDCGSCKDLITDDSSDSGFIVTLCNDCAFYRDLEV